MRKLTKWDWIGVTLLSAGLAILFIGPFVDSWIIVTVGFTVCLVGLAVGEFLAGWLPL